MMKSKDMLVPLVTANALLLPCGEKNFKIALSTVIDLITKQGFVNLDFHDIKAGLKVSGYIFCNSITGDNINDSIQSLSSLSEMYYATKASKVLLHIVTEEGGLIILIFRVI